MRRALLALIPAALPGCSTPVPERPADAVAADSATPGVWEGSRDKESPEVVQEWTRRKERVEQELASLGEHPWAGSYYQGDGLGANLYLTLAPDTGFTFMWRGCLGVYDRSWGAVREQADGLHLEFALPNDREGYQGCPEVLVPVTWGERVYLVEETDFASFCNDVNMGFEPRAQLHGNVFLRHGDEEKPAPGRPELPERYRGWLLDAPLEARVVAVGESSVEEEEGFSMRTTLVTLDVGRSRGVYPGMSFLFLERGFCSVDVAEVEEESCTGFVFDFGAESPLPEVGWTCRTSMWSEDR